MKTVRGGQYLSTSKNDKSRRVDMSLQLTETLWMLKHERERILKDNMPEWVFHNQAGNLMNSHNWRSRVINKALEKLNSDMSVFTIFVTLLLLYYYKLVNKQCMFAIN